MEFRPMEPAALADACFGLLFGLEDPFERRVDLLMRSAIDNPYILECIESGCESIHVAEPA